MNHSDYHRVHELGSPRWGFAWFARTVTQAVVLGWHTAATLWRKRGITRATRPMSRWEDSPQLGYEILPNKYCYRYRPPTPAKELLAEFWRLEKESEGMLEGLAKGSRRFH